MAIVSKSDISMKAEAFNEGASDEGTGFFQYNYPYSREDGMNHYVNFRFIELYEQKASARHNSETAEATNAKKGRKTLGSITMYQPGGIGVSYAQNWDKTDGMLATYGSAANKLTASGAAIDMGSTALAQAGVGIARGLYTANMAAETGIAINPFLGVSYISPDLRSQSFTFNFTPRNEAEAFEVMNIIHSFKYYTHPQYANAISSITQRIFGSNKDEGATTKGLSEKDAGILEKWSSDASGTAGKLKAIGDKFALKAPAIFDINFIDASGGVNENLYKFGPAVCTDVSCNYSPAGVWRSFKNGVPTQVDLSLSFQEMEILTKDKIDGGF